MIPRCTGPDCASPTHRGRLLRAIVGTGFSSGDEMPGDCAGSDPCDEADGTIALGHALHPRRSDLRLSELLTCAMRGASGEAKATRSYVQRSVDAFRAVPFDVKRHQLGMRSPPLHREHHGLRLRLALAHIINRAAPSRAKRLSGAIHHGRAPRAA